MKNPQLCSLLAPTWLPLQPPANCKNIANPLSCTLMASTVLPLATALNRRQWLTLSHALQQPSGLLKLALASLPETQKGDNLMA